MGSTRAQPGERAASPAAEPEERGFDEAIALYEGEWVLMKVTEFDQHHRPVRGLVIAHSPDRGAISDALSREPRRPPHGPYQPYYTFNAFPRLRPGEPYEAAAVRIAVERSAAEAERRGRRRP